MSQLLGVAAYQTSHLKLLSIISVLAADCREYVVIARSRDFPTRKLLPTLARCQYEPRM
jgi:hypothetical protein